MHFTGIPNGLPQQCVSRFGLKKGQLHPKDLGHPSRPPDLLTAVLNIFLESLLAILMLHEFLLESFHKFHFYSTEH
jgi:hypothetical protein